jgi:Na+-driven multidrug efflux pump
VQNTASIEEGKMFLLVGAPTYILPGIKLIADGTLRGLGKMKYFMISTFTDLSLRVILAFVFSDLLGSVGIWCAWPVGWLVSTVLSLIFYKGSTPKIVKV